MSTTADKHEVIRLAKAHIFDRNKNKIIDGSTPPQGGDPEYVELAKLFIQDINALSPNERRGAIREFRILLNDLGTGELSKDPVITVDEYYNLKMSPHLIREMAKQTLAGIHDPDQPDKKNAMSELGNKIKQLMPMPAVHIFDTNGNKIIDGSTPSQRGLPEAAKLAKLIKSTIKDSGPVGASLIVSNINYLLKQLGDGQLSEDPVIVVDESHNTKMSLNTVREVAIRVLYNVVDTNENEAKPPHTPAPAPPSNKKGLN